jgi:hypothetical protein
MQIEVSGLRALIEAYLHHFFRNLVWFKSVVSKGVLGLSSKSGLQKESTFSQYWPDACQEAKIEGGVHE